MNINDIRNFPSQREMWAATLYLQEAYQMGARRISEIEMPDDIRETVQTMIEFRKQGIEF